MSSMPFLLRKRSSSLALLASFIVLISISNAVNAGSFAGRVVKISSTGRSMTVSSLSSKQEKDIALPRNLKVSIDSRPGKIEQVEVGDLITFILDSRDRATAAYVRKQKPDDQPKPKPIKSDEPSSEPTVVTDESVSKDSWPQFLGFNRKNISQQENLLKSWPQGGPKWAWTARNLGEGYSSVSVVNDLVYTIGTRGGREVVLCFDLQSGQEQWTADLGNNFNEGQGNGPRSTPTFDDGYLYCLGANGDLGCYDASSGRESWKVNVLSRFGGSNIVWGISESPLVDGDVVICTPGGRNGTMVGLNKSTGETVWAANVPQSPQAAYASVIAANINGKKQYINFCHNGLFAVDAGTHTPLWGNDAASNSTANCSSPIVVSNRIFYASNYGVGGALLSVDRNRVNVVYQTKQMKNHHGGMVLWQGHIYGANDSILTCLNVTNGTATWQERLSGNGKGAITLADGQLYFRSENGPMYLVEANSNSFQLKGEFDQPERSGRPAWARPVVARGKLFLRDQDILLCYDLTAE